jgi:hypothetical protein
MRDVTNLETMDLLVRIGEINHQSLISEAQAVIRARIESQVNKLERNSETAFIL